MENVFNLLYYHVLSMILNKYLSSKGIQIDRQVDLSSGTLAWSLRAKKRSSEDPNFIDATIGSALDDDGELLVAKTFVNEMRNLSATQLFGYAPLRGITDFVNFWKRDTLESFPLDQRVKAENMSTLPVTSCGGLTSGLMNASQVFLDADDPILLPNTRWGNVDNVFLKNRRLRELKYKLVDDEGRLNFYDLVAQLKLAEKSERKLSLYLNFPNNPSGISPSMEDVKILQEALEEITIPLIIMIDDAYEGYVYENDVIDHSIFPYLLGLNDNVLTVKVDGLSKRYCAYGARLGMITLGFGEELNEEQKNDARELVAKAARTNTSSAPRAVQEAIVKIISDPIKKAQLSRERKEILELLRSRYIKTKKLSFENESPVMQPVHFNSGYFSYYTLKGEQSAKDIATKLLEKGLGTVPFVNERNNINGIRLAFCSIKEDKLETTFEKLYSTY